MQLTQENAYKLRILQWSTVAIASVVIVEVTLGSLVNSLAILSDGLHALLDTVTSLLLFFATKAALKPPDEEHTYGHEKFETIGGLIGGIVLIGVAILVAYEAALRLMAGVGVGIGLEYAGFIAIGFTFAMDFVRIVIFRKAASIESATVKVGFYHAIADLSSTFIALFGFALAALARVYWGDSLASIVLAILLSYLSVRLVRSSVMELSDAASKDTVQKIKKEILSHEGVLKTLTLKTRKAGSKLFVETTVQVPNSMSLEEAHALASKVEAKLAATFGNVDATIHIEPSERDTGMEQLVAQLAAVEGVHEVHEIATVYASGKLFLTLHLCVDSQLSVKEAHNIAERVESRLHDGIKQLENVTVHLEPCGDFVHTAELTDDELKQIIHKVAKKVEQSLRCKRILVYKANGKRYVSLDCAFTGQIALAEAHEIASMIEKEVRERFADAIVTVHVEPDVAEKE